MPSRPCKHPTCSAYIPRGPDRYCPAHAEIGRQEARARNSFYDQHIRNPEAVAFYASEEWKRARRKKLASSPVCERCQRVWAEHVHHIKPLAQCRPEERIDEKNLMSLCPPCHNTVEAEAKNKGTRS